MGLEDSLQRELEKKDFNKTEGVDMNSDNSLDHLGHPAFEYLMGGIVIAGTVLGMYAGYKCNNMLYGTIIGATIPSLLVGGAMEERYDREDRLRDEKNKLSKNQTPI